MSYNPTLRERKEKFRDNAFKNKERSPERAIEMAYADMSRRQNGHAPEMKAACVRWLEMEVFTPSLQITDFPQWHRETCKALAAKLNGINSGFGTIGRAQKVINMAIKYLSCISDQYDGILEHCHMTLDGYTLDWYQSCVRGWARDAGLPVPEGEIKWSRIERYEDYELIQNNIRSYLKQNREYRIPIGSGETEPVVLPASPFDAEFIIWEGGIVKEKYNGLIKALNNYIPEQPDKESGREKDRWLIGSSFDAFLREYCKRL